MEDRKVELQDMLDARERRANEQHTLQKSCGLPVLSFSMNIPGDVKTGEDIKWGFETGKKAILAVISGLRAKIADRIEHDGKTGYELLMAVDADPVVLKKHMCNLEDSMKAGRLYDIDVIGTDGEKISREELGAAPRKCLICGEDAFVCARSRRHSLEELKSAVRTILSDAGICETASMIAKTAQKAMLSEVLVTPKPGLVDREGSGAHEDMDVFTFADSSAALRDYLYDCALTGAKHAGSQQAEGFAGCPDPKAGGDSVTDELACEMFSLINTRGMIADQEMFAETESVNTHKGLIFSMGLLCCAYGYVCALPWDDKGESSEVTDRALELCSRMALSYQTGRIDRQTTPELEDAGETAGEKALRLYGVKGILGEAASGFESVKKVLPLYKDLRKGLNRNDAGVITLLRLISICDDTNMIKRAGYEEACAYRKKIEEMLDQSGSSHSRILDFAASLDKEFCAKKISPGGSADLLALVFMIVDIERKL